ncbi:MAG TPA: DUF1801 domain-containing protein [Mycobacteriales bacterium]|nr:DUF1801 domain-containing protein [Mycobacteriales bacterium]
MPKSIKGLAGRKPPEPAADHSDIDAWFGQIMPGMQPIVRGLDDAIRAAIPGLQYAVKRGRAYYGLPDLGWIIELAPYHVSVNIVFYGGADFEPPPPLGDTDRTRYVKLSSVDDRDRPDVRDWIKQAGRTPGWR